MQGETDGARGKTHAGAGSRGTVCCTTRSWSRTLQEENGYGYDAGVDRSAVYQGRMDGRPYCGSGAPAVDVAAPRGGSEPTASSSGSLASSGTSSSSSARCWYALRVVALRDLDRGNRQYVP